MLGECPLHGGCPATCCRWRNGEDTGHAVQSCRVSTHPGKHQGPPVLFSHTCWAVAAMGRVDRTPGRGKPSSMGFLSGEPCTVVPLQRFSWPEAPTVPRGSSKPGILLGRDMCEPGLLCHPRGWPCSLSHLFTFLGEISLGERRLNLRQEKLSGNPFLRLRRSCAHPALTDAVCGCVLQLCVHRWAALCSVHAAQDNVPREVPPAWLCRGLGRAHHGLRTLPWE